MVESPGVPVPAFVPKAHGGKLPWEKAQPLARMMVLTAAAGNAKIHPNLTDQALYTEVTPRTLSKEIED